MSITTRKSIEPTYDSRESGCRYCVETRINGFPIRNERIADPFITTKVRINFWDALKAFLTERKLHVEVIVMGDPEIVEDVMELDANYLGVNNSTRRQSFRRDVETALANLAEIETGGKA